MRKSDGLVRIGGEVFPSEQAARDVGHDISGLGPKVYNPSQLTKRLHERWREEQLAIENTAGLFLAEVRGYCTNHPVGLEEIPLDKKAELLKTYSGFTGITKPSYPDGLSLETVNDTFRRMCRKARSLFDNA